MNEQADRDKSLSWDSFVGVYLYYLSYILVTFVIYVTHVTLLPLLLIPLFHNIALTVIKYVIT